MKKTTDKKSKVFLALLVLLMLFSLCACGSRNTLQKKAETTAKVLYKAYGAEFGTEWLILSLAGNSGVIKENWRGSYQNSAREKAEENEGLLSPRALTRQSLAVVALTAAGNNAADFYGYDLLQPLANYDKVLQQGISGAAWALIASRCGGYEFPPESEDAVQTSPEDFLSYILSRQTPDGGFAFSGETADPDITAMVLIALSFYQEREDVSKVIAEALNRLSELQLETGGFASYGVVNAESTAQVLIALTCLGVSVEDEAFVKNGKSALEALDAYRLPDGTYCHEIGGETDGMASEQALLALTAVIRVQQGEMPLFRYVEE